MIFWCRKLPSLTICCHHWGHALMDWDIATSKPPIFMTASPILWELSSLLCHGKLNTITILVSVVLMVMQSHQTPGCPKQELSVFSCFLLIDPCHFIINTSPICSASLETLFIWKWHRSIYKRLENAALPVCPFCRLVLLRFAGRLFFFPAP